MRKVVTTGFVLSALLAWSALSVGQNTAPQAATQTPVAQSGASAAAGQTAAAPAAVETGTVAGGGVLGTGLGVTEAVVVGAVAVGTAAAVSNTNDTTPSSPTATATR